MKFRNFLFTLIFGILLISAFSLIPVNAAIEAPDGFSDVSEMHQNVKAIEYLREEGVLVGYEDGTFKPDSTINRAEFMKIVMEASDYELGGENCYPDVSDEWFAQYVCAATATGLVEGYPDGYFRPEKQINFAEGSKIVANILGLDMQDFSDDEDWYKPFVLSLEEKQAIPDDIVTFNDLLTRGQMSEMIWRIDADRTYKLSKTYENITLGQELSDELYNFESCNELHDYFEDNLDEHYGPFLEEKEEIPSGAIATASQMAELGGCFTGETQILMANGGYKLIKDIKEGDMIRTRKDLESSELVAAEVESTINHYVPGYLVINDNLEVTTEHIVLVNGIWDVAGNVEEGDFLMNSDGAEVEVYSIEEVNEATWVYNFEVDDYHTYIANDFYVHNEKGASADMSSTNVQVQGVDEADIVKNDGRYIYFLKGRSVRIVETYPTSGMRELDRIDFSESNFWPEEMYVDEDKLVVVGNANVGSYFDDFEESLVDPAYYHRGGSAKVYVYDISNKENVNLVRELAIEGDYDSSRKIDDTVYMVSTQNNNVWPWGVNGDWNDDDLVPLVTNNGTLDKLVSCEEIMYMPRTIDEANFMIVTAVPLNPNEEFSSEVVMGSSTEIYSSRENMYVAQEKYDWYGWYDETAEDEETYIHKFSLNGNNVEYKGMNSVPGTVLNQFSMDEYEGDFRVVTTLGEVWDSETLSTNNLYILDSNLNLAGKVEGLAPGEEIYSARFVGDRVYVVTFKKVDPLFVISAQDPTNPVVLGQLKIPGFSNYLHPYDENHIIGFGLDTQEATKEEIESRQLDFAWFQGVKMAMFDVTDVSNPVELHREIIGDRGTSSLLNYDHKALLYSTTKGINGSALMAFPIAVAEIPQDVKDDPDSPGNTYGEYVFQGAYVYDVNVEDGFSLRGTITHYEEEIPEESGYYWYGPNAIERIIYIGDYFYTVSQAMIMANEMVSPLDVLNRLELAE
ncbi:beta-propeller domain-containing protein [Patescibacteria group bacterium]